MSLFFNNYNKPGPGVGKDEPQKSAPLRFFEIFFRKLGQLVQVNLIFMIPLLVCLAMMYGILMIPAPHYAFYSALFNSYIDIYLLYALPLPLILLAPFTLGMAYITRNYAREEHAFVWSDFWEAVKNNWKAGLLNGVIVYLSFAILSFCIMFYFNQTMDNWFSWVPLTACCILAVFMLFAQYYVPVMIVTFDLKLRHIYRNAFIFGLAGLLRNLMLTAIFAAMIVGIFFCPGGFLLIVLVLAILILFSFISFLCSFSTYSLLEKYLIRPQYEKSTADTASGVRNGQNFDFDRDELDDEDAPKYVYVNGRLIERSLLKDEDIVFSDETKQHLS